VTVIDEINSIYDYVKAMYPVASIARQDVPQEPAAGTFVILSQDNDIKTETSVSYVNDREFKLVYYGTSSVDVLTKMSELSRKLNNDEKLIPLRGSSRYIRVKGFSYGPVFKSQGGIPYSIASMQAETREARDLPTETKISDVSVATKE
jgi:hypothetical protein